MKVLSLVTNWHSEFYQQQIESLENLGVEFTHVYPASQWQNREKRADDSRSVLDYAKMYSEVIRNSGDEYDLIHSNNGLTTPFAILQPNRPIVASYWGSDLMGTTRFLCQQCSRLCDERIVMSGEMADILPSDCHIIPHGVDLSKFKPIDKTTAKKHVGWTDDSLDVLFPYKPSREVKNHPLAQQVVEGVGSEISDPVDLKVVYDVPHDEVPIFMNAADALLLTSHREGSPNTVKEAMACNLPIISTDVGDVRDRLRNVKNSSVGETKSELEECLAEILRRDNPSNGRKYADEVGLEAMANNILGVYHKALNQQ